MWVQVLDSIPDIDMLSYLPQLLEGLMGMLADPNKEVRNQAHKALLVSQNIHAHFFLNFDFTGTNARLLFGSSRAWHRCNCKPCVQVTEILVHPMAAHCGYSTKSTPVITTCFP